MASQCRSCRSHRPGSQPDRSSLPTKVLSSPDRPGKGHMDTQLPGILGSMGPILDRYGYLAVFAIVFVESFGVPAPGQTILVLAGVYAGAGHLNVVAVALFGLLAAVIGDSLGFLIGRFGGRQLVLRFGRYFFITDERLHKAESFFARHGNKIVATGRFVDGLRQVNGL